MAEEKEEKFKKSFYISQELSTEWDEWQGESKRDQSVNGAAAMLLIMEVSDNLRGQLRKLAFSPDIKAARKEAKKLLTQSVVQEYLEQYYEKIGPEKKAQILEDARQSEKKLRDKK